MVPFTAKQVQPEQPHAVSVLSQPTPITQVKSHASSELTAPATRHSTVKLTTPDTAAQRRWPHDELPQMRRGDHAGLRLYQLRCSPHGQSPHPAPTIPRHHHTAHRPSLSRRSFQPDNDRYGHCGGGRGDLQRCRLQRHQQAPGLHPTATHLSRTGLPDHHPASPIE
jgi:hypothetical protein